MSRNNLKPENAVLEDLKEQGFTTDFRFAKGKLIPMQYASRSYKPSDVTILDTYRFEGDSDPADMSILYVIETTDGLKGTIANVYGAGADTELEEFLDQTKNMKV